MAGDMEGRESGWDTEADGEGWGVCKRNRDGHADADDADSCRMMRICAYAYACRQKKSDSAKREKLTFFKRQ